MNTRDFGRLGEKAAAKYMKKNGCRILGLNVYVGHEELDIVAVDGDSIIFVEVKTRTQIPDSDDSLGRPADAVNCEKRRHLISAAHGYMRAYHDKIGFLSPRIDIIEVYVNPDSKRFKVLEIRHFPGSVHR